MTLGVLLYGLLLGMRHALEPDHLAAVSTMAAHGWSRRDVLRVSTAWGAGHAAAVLLVGWLLLALRREALWADVYAETLVGMALIAVGGWSLLGLRWEALHVHRHAHGETVHVHFHLHPPRLPTARAHPPHAHLLGPHRLQRPLVAFLVGCVHGLAGSGGAAPRGGAAAYLLAFGVGGIAGMAAVSLLALWPLLHVSVRLLRTRRLVQAASGLASVAVGVLLVLGGVT